MKDTDFLFLTSLLRAREPGMLSEEKIGRMLAASGYDDAAKILTDCGYPDMSGSDADQIESILQKRRNDVYHEINNYEYARDLLDLFRMKYDYHNVKVLIKSSGASVTANHLLSVSGRIGAQELSDAFISGQRAEILRPVATAMDSAAGILARTGNPQLADTEIDKAYFAELSALAESLDDAFISGYIRLLIDSANLRIVVRSKRTGRDGSFLKSSAIPGGSLNVEQIASSYDDNALALFTSDALSDAVSTGHKAIGGDAQTGFERACDNAVLFYVTNTAFISFGPAPVIAYLAKLDWEITTVRMILTGMLTGISPGVIRERLRECHV